MACYGVSVMLLLLSLRQIKDDEMIRIHRTYRICKFEGKRPPGNRGTRWEYDMKVVIK
jgi:hypothetical protein